MFFFPSLPVINPLVSVTARTGDFLVDGNIRAKRDRICFVDQLRSHLFVLNILNTIFAIYID